MASAHCSYIEDGATITVVGGESHINTQKGCDGGGAGCYPEKQRKHIICMHNKGPGGNTVFKTKPSNVSGILKMVSLEAENQLQDAMLSFQP